VTKLEAEPIAPEAFRYDARNFVVDDAKRDIERD